MNGAGRDEHIDAVRGALMLLVIFGHLLENFLSQSPLYRGVYSGIYLFHMPLFVFIGGMYSKAVLAERDYRGIVARLVLPLVVFQVLYLWVDYLQHGRLTIPVLQPFWILWFFLSMVQWKLSLPLILRLPLPILWAVGLAITAGYSRDVGYAFSMSRTLYFLPFFVAGHLWGEAVVRFVARHRVFGVVAFGAAIAGIVAWTSKGLPYQALYGSTPYRWLPIWKAHPGLGRAAVLALSAVASAGFFAVVRTRFRPLAWLGERTLTVFVLHGFVVIGLREIAKRLGIGDSWMVIPACAVLTVVVGFALAPADPWLKRAFGWMTRRRAA